MKILKLFLLIFISISFPVKADLDNKLEKQIKKGGNLIFIRNAYANGGGDLKNFLNSFFSAQFASNKNQQIKDLKKYIKSWQSDKNLVLVTHYVLISEILNYTSSSGEIVISDKNFKVIDSFKIEY